MNAQRLYMLLHSMALRTLLHFPLEILLDTTSGNRNIKIEQVFFHMASRKTPHKIPLKNQKHQHVNNNILFVRRKGK